MKQAHQHRSPPLKEMLKGIPGFFGIHLNEVPKYDVIYNEDNVEIRRYAPVVMAQISFDGEYDEFQSKAFTSLADYIFGDNISEEKLSSTQTLHEPGMTAATQIPMTSPVFQERSEKAWTMSFVLPSEYTLDNVPKPTNPRIRLKARPEKLVAVWSYSGNNTPEKIQEVKNELTQWLQAHPEFHVRSHFWWAQYDAPMTIPFLKKNEMHIWVEENSRA